MLKMRTIFGISTWVWAFFGLSFHNSFKNIPHSDKSSCVFAKHYIFQKITKCNFGQIFKKIETEFVGHFLQSRVGRGHLQWSFWLKHFQLYKSLKSSKDVKRNRLYYVFHMVGTDRQRLIVPSLEEHRTSPNHTLSNWSNRRLHRLSNWSTTIKGTYYIAEKSSILCSNDFLEISNYIVIDLY